MVKKIIRIDIISGESAEITMTQLRHSLGHTYTNIDEQVNRVYSGKIVKTAYAEYKVIEVEDQ